MAQTYTKDKIDQLLQSAGTAVVANPTPAGTTALTGIQIGNTKYVISGEEIAEVEFDSSEQQAVLYIANSLIAGITTSGATHNLNPFGNSTIKGTAFNTYVFEHKPKTIKYYLNTEKTKYLEFTRVANTNYNDAILYTIYFTNYQENSPVICIACLYVYSNKSDLYYYQSLISL